MSNLLKDWNATRIIQFLLGTGFIVYALVEQDYWFLMWGALFLVQGIFKLSFCGARGCSTSVKPNEEQLYKDEIKTYKSIKK